MSNDKFRDLLQGLRLNFLEIVANRCQDLEVLILQLQHNDKSSPEFEEIFRIVHSLKGSGGTHGVQLVTKVCHYLEDVLVDPALTQFDETAIDRLLAFVDILKAIPSNEPSRQGQVCPQLQAQLDALKETRLSSNKTVVLLEPSRSLRLFLHDMLVAMGFQVIVMHNSVETLQRLIHDPVDLMILSFENADLNGAAIVSAIRANRSINEAAPAIILSSQPSLNVSISRVLVVPRTKNLHRVLQQAVDSIFSPSKEGQHESMG
ncbi:Hpt domain-containing protein [Alkalimonas delamerensis]|uniref:Hpt domain-containing protein n=1 Tax=Alkalimonas delamerensis TaxID=265981 RepID=A0ABT9GNG8_9GAMM|nr:hybrid sensor histidine kinase/response regulator [Alkalimonas delamerensis]MDP4528494.1 Hpt domain-containing protein [Alkalimonas delamerensis]